MSEILRGLHWVQISLHDGWSVGVEEETEGGKREVGTKAEKGRVEVELELEVEGNRED